MNNEQELETSFNIHFLWTMNKNLKHPLIYIFHEQWTRTCPLIYIFVWTMNKNLNFNIYFSWTMNKNFNIYLFRLTKQRKNVRRENIQTLGKNIIFRQKYFDLKILLLSCIKVCSNNILIEELSLCNKLWFLIPLYLTQFCRP